jgi:1-acyl-sn-glycerol-3-phosphate acyltransferase
MIRAFVIIFLLLCNLCFWGSAVLLFSVAKLFVRGPKRAPIIRFLARFGEGWVAVNNRIFDALLTTEWDIEGIDGVRYDGHYLIISNHVSWVDIFALFRAFHGKAAFIRFFLKQQLIWFPIAGQACWALEFPFMRRYTPEYLERHPEKRGQDLETTRILCRRYRRVPVAILNFVEGTRFSREKHGDQESPYRHLLRPRIGGISFVLASFGDQLDAVFDVTLAYPNRDVTMWEFVTNRVPRIVIRARRLEVTPELIDPAVTQPGPPREKLKEWLDGLWREKDALLEEISRDVMKDEC